MRSPQPPLLLAPQVGMLCNRSQDFLFYLTMMPDVMTTFSMHFLSFFFAAVTYVQAPHEIRSPHRKKSTPGNLQFHLLSGCMVHCAGLQFFAFFAVVSTPRSPCTTPKRKVPQADLMWPASTVDALLAQCIVRKQRVQVEEPSIAVWKEVASALGKAGHAGITWQMCRAKLESLNKFFAETLLRTGGKLGGVEFPHYSKLCALHDIPSDFVMPESIPDAPNCKFAVIWRY